MKDPGEAARLFICLGGLQHDGLARKVKEVHWDHHEREYTVYLTNGELIVVPEAAWINDLTKATIAIRASMPGPGDDE